MHQVAAQAYIVCHVVSVESLSPKTVNLLPSVGKPDHRLLPLNCKAPNLHVSS